MTDNGRESPHLTDAEFGSLIYSVGENRDFEHYAYSHIAVCAQCMTRLGELREADRHVDRLLIALDVSRTMKSADSVIRVARARGGAGQPGGLGRRWHRAAAVVACIVVGAVVAAAAIPSFPLHRLLVTLVGSSGGASMKYRVAGKPQATKAMSPGISFVGLTGAPLEVAFGGAGVGGTVDVRVVDGDQVSLSSRTTGSTYRVSSNRIAVDQSTPAQFKLEIPRSLRELRVRVAGKVVFERGGGALANSFTINLSHPDAAGH